MTRLFAHQEEFLSRNPRRRILIWETGTGKTLAALEWAKLNSKKGVLIICPKGLKTNWKRSIERFFPEGYVDSHVVSKEEFKKIQQEESLPAVDSVIIDEMHYFAGISSQLSKCLYKFLNAKGKEIPYVLGLTATPYMSTPMNVYVLGRHMGMAGSWNYQYFMDEFFHSVRMGARMVPMMKEGKQDRVTELLWEIGDTVKLSECADVPDSVTETMWFKLTREQEKAIRDQSDPSFIARWTKIHQICGGTLKGDEYSPAQKFRSEKAEAAVKLASEIELPIIVCRYNHELDHLKELIDSQSGKRAHVINGDTKNRQEILDSLGADDVLLVNAAISEGWQLPKSDTIVFYSYDFALKNYVQMRGRIQRIDNLKKCRYVSLVAEGTIDEGVYRSIVEDKMEFHLNIYDRKQKAA